MLSSQRAITTCYSALITSLPLLLLIATATNTAAATIVVNSLADTQANDGACTLREAIINANNDSQSGSIDCAAGNGADVIAFDVAGTITLSQPLPAIGERCVDFFNCPRVDAELAIDGANQITISGGNLVPLFLVNCSDHGMFPDNPCEAGGSLTLLNLALVDSRAVAIANGHRFSMSNSRMSGNSAAIVNGGRATANISGSVFSANGLSTGFTISNYGNMSIFATTFDSNSGAHVLESIHEEHFADQRRLSVFFSTFANNSGVALFARDFLKATALVSFSTFSGNGAAIQSVGDNPFLLSVSYSILANSTGMGGNCSGGLFDQGNNIDDGSSCGFSAANNSKSNTDPLIDPAGLTNNGGRIPMFALCTGVNTPSFGCTGISPAIDGGLCDGVKCNIGAFRLSGALPPTSIFARPHRLPQGEFITVTWSGIRVPTQKDWIALYRPGVANTGYVSWAYTNTCQTTPSAVMRATGACELFVPFALTDGLYELRLLTNDGFNAIAVSDLFVVGGPPLPPSSAVTLNVNPSTLSRGTFAMISWNGIHSPTTKDWLGLFAPGAVNTAYLAWVYNSSCQTIAGALAKASGTCALFIPTTVAPGIYEIRLLANDGFKLLTGATIILVQ